jgi:hypothetical protein
MDWRTSTYSNANGGNCVETASGDGVVMVRDTTNRDGGTLALSAGAWRVFMSKIKNALQGDPIRAAPFRGPPSLRVRSGSARSGDVEVARRCFAPPTLEQ